MDPRTWKIFFASGCALLLLYLFHLSPEIEGLMLVGTSLASALAMLYGLYVQRPNPLAAWILICISQFLFTVGNVLFVLHAYLENPYLPEDISSPVFVVGMLCSLFGLIVLFFRFRKLITSESFLYGCIIAVGLTSFFWVTQISPYLTQDLNLQYWTEIIIYPAGLMAIALPLSLFMMTSLGSTWSYRFLFITMLVTSLSIIQYSGVVVRSDPSTSFTLNDSLILSDFFNSVAYLFLGTAYLHPSFQQFSSSLPNKSTVISRLDLFILGSAFCMAPIAYLRMRFEGFELDVTPVLIGMLVIFVLVQTRLAQLVRLLESQNQQVNHQKELLHHQANHDTLTHLPNRLYLVNYLKETIESTLSEENYGAIFMIDLNHFKEVNDTYGHDQGDIILQKMAGHFSRLKRKGDMVARWGGDEFVFVLNRISTQEDAYSFAGRLFREAVCTVTHQAGSLTVDLSIGICLFRGTAENMDTLLKNADIALYQAKAASVNKIAFYEPGL